MKMSLLVALVVVLVSASIAEAQDQRTLAKGWTVVKSEEAPPGTKLQFSNDGKLNVTFVIDGKTREFNGSYTLIGDKLTLKLLHDGREKIETRTVKKLTESVLITEDKNRKVEELSAVK